MATDVLLSADLRGIDSHGVVRLPGYVRLWEVDRINTDPEREMIEKRKKEGISIMDSVVEELKELADKYGIRFPQRSDAIG